MIVLRAAAGCGKTTALTARYLGWLAEGCDPESIVAVTFTRRAAAELRERVALALHAAMGEPAARTALGPAAPVYLDAAPRSRADIQRALDGLPTAPIGTTDAFVQTLLSEFALDAAVPLPSGGAVPLDLPIRAGAGPRAAMAARARALCLGEGGVDPDALRALHRAFEPEPLLACVGSRTPWDAEPLATADALARAVASVVAQVWTRAGLPDAARWPTSGSDPIDSAVAQWRDDGAVPAEAPPALLAILPRLPSGVRAALSARRVDLGPASVSVTDLVSCFAAPFHTPEAIAQADHLRREREALRLRAADEGVRAALAAGDAGHEDLLAAAIALVKTPPAGLLHRFSALLVDEAQDADPSQLALYRGLAALPGVGDRVCLVGDSRQSIYGFRGAAPRAFAQLAAAATHQATLDQNHRSHARLVAGQHALVQPLAGPNDLGLDPLEPLDAITAGPETAGRALPASAHLDTRPVWLVRGDPDEPLSAAAADLRALDAFLERLDAAWATADGQHDDGAVLAPTWRDARIACDAIRARCGPTAARVEGQLDLALGTVPTDLRSWLTALADPDDDLAWLAAWRHPAFGLSDAGLAAARAAGVAMAAIVGLDGPLPTWSAADADAFTAARDAVRAARGALAEGRRGGALETLVHALHARALWAVGPDGDTHTATLEALLDGVRELDQRGADLESVLSWLAGRGGEAPTVHLDTHPRTIACTTVFQAKGLAWDHVLVWSVGKRPQGAREDEEPPPIWANVHRTPRRLIGLRYDPSGAFSPSDDPIARLSRLIHAQQENSEVARLAYVAVTRARRSVVVGLPDLARAFSPGRRRLISAWSLLPTGDAVAQLRRSANRAPPAEPAPTWVTATAPIPAPWVAPVPWVERAPSDASWMSAAVRAQLASAAASRVALGGFSAGEGAVDPPVLADWRAADWGTLAHGWVAAWAFEGPPSPDRVAAWLREDRGEAPPAVVDWLVGISLRMRGSPLWAIATHPKARRQFELGLVALDPDHRALLSGRVDLLVTRGAEAWVIDFKAGGRSPARPSEVLAMGGLDTYAPQLEAYRRALGRTGVEVTTLAIWYLRTGAAVWWS
jgi:ATP-dependent helicase/nuclease subunit A